MIRVLQNEVFHLTRQSSKQNYSVSTQQRREREREIAIPEREKERKFAGWSANCVSSSLSFSSLLCRTSPKSGLTGSDFCLLVSVCLGRFGVTKWEIQPSVPNTRLAESIRGSDWAESDSE